jgi:uncharacterized membrane protein
MMLFKINFSLGLSTLGKSFIVFLVLFGIAFLFDFKIKMFFKKFSQLLDEVRTFFDQNSD